MKPKEVKGTTEVMTEVVTEEEAAIEVVIAKVASEDLHLQDVTTEVSKDVEAMVATEETMTEMEEVIIETTEITTGTTEVIEEIEVIEAIGTITEEDD